MTAKRFALAALLMLAAAVPAQADFRDVARAVSREPGVKRQWIPFLGLARMAVWMVEPHGVGDFQVAVFEGGGFGDARHFEALMNRHAGKGFQPLVRVRERSGEWSYIYVRPGRHDRFELMMLVHDSSDTVLVRVEVDGVALARHLDSPKSVVTMARR